MTADSPATPIIRQVSTQRPTPEMLAGFRALSPTTLADAVPRDAVMDGIRPLWEGVARIAGPAYTVRCAAGDNLMAHAAIHRAAPGDVLVIQAVDAKRALAGGNMCAWAQRRGIIALV